jgi:hypothetical protein
MTFAPISYDVVKVDELNLIERLLNGNDEIIVNDLLDPLLSGNPETKRCRVINLADSLKPFIFTVASETEFGVIKVGDGLSIDPLTGVLSTTRNELGDLNDVTLSGVKDRQIIVYNGNEWVNTDASQVFVEMVAGDGIEITGKGTDTEVINVKTGQGITIVNDEVTADLGKGVRIINDKIEANLAAPLYFQDSSISLNIAGALYVTPGQALSVAYGVGLRLDRNNALEVDPNVVITKTSDGIGNDGWVVPGDIFCRNITCVDLNSLSDITLKENVETVSNSLEILKSLRGVSFDWKDGSGSTLGVIAQEVEEVLPQLVSTSETKSVSYNGLVGLLIEAVKELSKEVEELKNK